MYTLNDIKSDYDLSSEEIEDIKRAFGINDLDDEISKELAEEISMIAQYGEDEDEFYRRLNAVVDSRPIPEINPPEPEPEKISEIETEDEGPIIDATDDTDDKKPRIEHAIIHVAEITDIADDPTVRFGSIPTTSNLVFVRTLSDSEIKDIRLGEKIGDGLEGDVYKTELTDKGTPLVAKIFNRSHCTRRREEKIKLFLNRYKKDKFGNITEGYFFAGICFPYRALENDQGEFIGYLMPEAKGVELSELLTSSRFNEVLPNADKRTLINIALNILEKILFLHQHDILVGDVSAKNILVKNSREVFFVDTDSYQIGRFPSPNYTDNFVPPENQKRLDSGERHADFMRTQGNELFSIAVLLFNILMMGQYPYNHKSREGQDEKSELWFYPYPERQIDEIILANRFNRIPDASWARMYDHLHYKVIEAFWDTFDKRGKHNTEETRYFVEDWQRLMTEYRRGISNNGWLLKADHDDVLLYPPHFRHAPKIKYEICKECDREFSQRYMKNGVCQLCRDEARSNKYVYLEKTCDYPGCNKRVRIPREQYERITRLTDAQKQKSELARWSQYCYNHRMTRCKGCKKEFHACDLNEQGLCEECRKEVQCSGCKHTFLQKDLVNGLCINCRDPKKNCALCGELVRVKECNEDGLCKDCQEKYVKLKCENCGRVFYTTHYEHDTLNPSLCPNCPPKRTLLGFKKGRQSKEGKFAKES